MRCVGRLQTGQERRGARAENAREFALEQRASTAAVLPLSAPLQRAWLRQALGGLLALAAAFTTLGGAARSHCQAQELTTEVAAAMGTGVERGGTSVHSVLQRSPVFLDASLRHWSDEDSRFVLGGSLRMELERAGEVGAAPRAELRLFLGNFELRPGIAAAFFLAPHTMLGPETSLMITKKRPNGLALFGMLDVAAYVYGSDVPKRSSVIVAALSFGAAMGL